MLSQADAFDVIDTIPYLSLIGFVVLFYDYILTFGSEISSFWSPIQRDWGTAIFLLNRYVSFFGHLPVIAEMFLHNPTENICSTLLHYHQYTAVIIQIIIGVILVTRTYALWGCSRKILLFLVMLSAAVISFGVWALSAQHYGPISFALYSGIIGCQSSLPLDRAYYIGAIWAGMVLFDTIIFALTVYKSLEFKRIGRRSLADILLRDGVIYFAVIGTTGLCNVFTFMFLREFSRGNLTIITNSFSSVCAGRLMLNIMLLRCYKK